MSGDRRKTPRQRCEGKVILRFPGSARSTEALQLYLRDHGPGGLSGTCFDCPAPRVNELYSADRPSEGNVRLRVAWSQTTMAGVHMVGLQYVRGPVAM
jgi:hypothetical protein